MQGATAACLAGCSSADADHRVDSPASVVAAGSPAPPSPSASSIGLPPVEPGAPAKAARATRERHEDALEAAIEAVGGLAFIQPGDSVFVKVNTNSGDPFPYSSSPAAVRWLGRAIKQRGGRAIFGDRSFWGDSHTSRNFDSNGIRLATGDVGAELLVLDDDVAWVELEPSAAPHWVPPIRLPRVVLEATHVINLACAKTHFISGATLALKNFLGLVHAVDRMRDGNLRSHDRSKLPHQIADIHRAVRPRLHLVDGFQALVTGGPTPMSGDGPTIVDARTVIASTDPIACDVAGILLLQEHAPRSEAVANVDAWEHPTVAGAIEGGIAGARRETTEIETV